MRESSVVVLPTQLGSPAPLSNDRHSGCTPSCSQTPTRFFTGWQLLQPAEASSRVLPFVLCWETAVTCHQEDGPDPALNRT